jgi:hypothetical protein
MTYVIAITNVFGQGLQVIGPFDSEREAEEWKWKYTEHKVNLVSVMEMDNPSELVQSMGLDG